MYSYGVHNSASESTLHGRDFFIEYIHDMKPNPETMANADFNTQSKTLLDELDSFRGAFGND